MLNPKGYETKMDVDRRIEKLVERHEALTQSLELLTHGVRELREAIATDSENIRTLARTAEIHERRVTG